MFIFEPKGRSKPVNTAALPVALKGFYRDEFCWQDH